ncbi:MAG: hypothetical protein QXG26_00980 [Candidatus Aenigmatarchaeota archaeon]
MKRDRWAEYRRFKDENPLVNLDEIGNVWKLPVYYAGHKLLEKINIPEEKRKNLASDIIGGLLDSWTELYRQKYKTLPRKIAPGLMIELDFSNGATTIRELYTVEYNGAEVPIYLKSYATEQGPTDEELKKGIEFVIKNNKSPYWTPTKGVPRIESKLNKYINGAFTHLAAKKYTRLDYGSGVEILEYAFLERFVRDETWLMQQYGPVIDSKTITLDDGTNWKVNVYGRPNKLMTYAYWKFGDLYYDMIDTTFDPIQDMLDNLGISEVGQASFVLDEYKAISRGRRGFFNPRGIQLAYEV